MPEIPTITVQEVVARRMLRLRRKLGITAADLLPASVAFESEKVAGGANNENGGASKDRRGDNARACDDHIPRWKKEAEDMMAVLGANADHAHEYPMTELKRKVRETTRGG